MSFRWYPAFLKASCAIAVCLGAPCQAAPELDPADLQKQSQSTVPHISNVSLIQGVGRRRKANPRPYTPMQQFTLGPDRRDGHEELFLRLFLTSVGFAGIFIAILTLRSLPPRRSR